VTGDGGPDGARDAEHVRRLAERVTGAGAALRALGAERTLRALAQAARRLADPGSDLGAHARGTLCATSGLSPAMVDWALWTQVAPDDLEAELRRLSPVLTPPYGDGAMGVAPARLAVAVLAGNVFTAALRAVAVPLLSGAPVVAKASSRDDAFPRLLARALREVDPEVAPAYGVVSFAGGAEALEDALMAGADVVSVFGGDATVARLRARLPATTRVVPHGHGVGAVFVPAVSVPDAGAARRVAEGIALDVAAFDQRGCLSPHAVWVERGGAVDGLGLAHLLADHGLAELARTLPRGALPTEVGGAQVQWRGIAAARGTLLERDGHAVSHEGDAPPRLGPGWRNVAVHDAADLDGFVARIRPLGVHLKALGVAGTLEVRRRIARALPPPLAPRVSNVGEMQTPPLGSLADGELPWMGVARFIEGP
jgi:hypothetical protein